MVCFASSSTLPLVFARNFSPFDVSAFDGEARFPLKDIFCREVRALMQHNALGKPKPRVEEKLANRLARAPRILLRHERVLSLKDWILHLRKPVLEAFSLAAVNVTATKDDGLLGGLHHQYVRI
jgi:hypothetical protein